MYLGKQKGKLVPCAQKPHTHGFHPENEPCTWCPEAPAPTPSYRTWPPALMECVHCGGLLDYLDILCPHCGGLV